MNQRDVYEVHFKFPDERVAPHPVIILSIPEVLECESTFIGVPISHSAEWQDDEYSFPLDNTDFDVDLIHPNSCARIHLLTVIHVSELVHPRRRLRTMNQDSFNRMFNEIQERVFGCT